MAEQQLVDYIKKAKLAGQENQQTRALLRQNGWTDAEIDNAFSAVSQPDAEQQKPKPAYEPEPRPQTQSEGKEHQVSGQPEINVKKDVSPHQQEPKPETSALLRQEDTVQPNMPHTKTGQSMILKLSVVFVLLALIGVIGAGAYFALAQGDLVQSLVDKTLSYFSPSVIVKPAASKNTQSSEAEAGAGTAESGRPEAKLSSKELFSVPPEYDSAKISLTAFAQSGGSSVYCAPLKTNSKISCFLNGIKFLENPYQLKPYWIGISPDGRRVVLLYFDSAKKQSFVFENGIESPRYDGPITYPKFSSNSQSFAFVVLGNDGKSFVVLDGKSSATHDQIFTGPEWSQDGRQILYVARDEQNIFWVADEIQLLNAEQ